MSVAVVTGGGVNCDIRGRYTMLLILSFCFRQNIPTHKSVMHLRSVT